MEIETGGAQGGMPEEELDAAQVHTGFEQMRCEGVSLMSISTLAA